MMCDVTLLIVPPTEIFLSQQCLVELDLLLWKVQKSGSIKTEHPHSLGPLGVTPSTVANLVTSARLYLS